MKALQGQPNLDVALGDVPRLTCGTGIATCSTPQMTGFSGLGLYWEDAACAGLCLSPLLSCAL